MTAQQKTIYVNFFDVIDPLKVNKFIQFCTEVIFQYNPTELYFFIASNGGDVDSGFVLYNYLVSLQKKLNVVMHNTGTIDSIANVIFMSGQKRFAAPNASFLFHGVMMNFIGPQSRTAITENLSRLDSMENRISKTISENSKLKEKELKELFLQGEGKDANFAIDKGLIDKIKIPSVPNGAIHLAMTFV